MYAQDKRTKEHKKLIVITAASRDCGVVHFTFLSQVVLYIFENFLLGIPVNIFKNIIQARKEDITVM